MRIIIGISGASGVLVGYRLLQELQAHEDIETHLILSKDAIINFKLETDITFEDVKASADFIYENDNMGALISSGSFKTDGMIVVPCSMKTLSGIAHGFDTNLLIRSADVCLKEGRKVVLVPREMPLSTAHIRNLLLAKENGCCIMPAMLTFYNNADTLEKQVNHLVGKILMQFDIQSSNFKAWDGGKHDE